MAQHIDALHEQLGEVFERTGLVTVAVAESLTGGELSAKLAATPGSGDWFLGGVVAYARNVKHDVLGVPPGPVVSEAAAAAMASGVCRALGADIGVAVTGVAGPDEQDGLPPGTVWIALHDDASTTTRLVCLSGTPEEIVDATCVGAIRLLIEHLGEATDDH
jgi:nicotinamide-nucleotide amidase